MLKFVILAALIVAITAAPQTGPTATREPVPILRSESNVSPDGSWQFNFEGGDGTARDETGTVVNPGKEEETFFRVAGSYKYIDADGKEIEVHYTADENGFVPVGTNIHQSISSAAKAAAEASH